MNRFRTKKKGKDDSSISGRPSIEAEPSGPFRMFGKKKMQDEEPKAELDLAAALPSSDDFRTSLLMTGLSARFSMLREQDDPNSKLGKASDDSVLHPKRQSRMAVFGGLGSELDDIAEVESLRAPQFGRLDSYQSDDASSMTGSVMTRAKPTEGNNLFGGRQKIYKLAAGSRAGMSGRALYDDDVAQSSFQRWRQAEKERNAIEDEQKNSTFDTESTLDYHRRRETSSTTSSVPSAARSSTAATSIASQPSSVKDTYTGPHPPGLERTVTRTRRLYEQGLNQDLHEHQSSSLSRIDTLSKQRPFGGHKTPVSASAIPSPSTSTFTDRVADRRPIMSKASAPNLRSFSPSATSPSPMSPTESGTSKFPRVDQKPNLGSSPPLSPPISETEEPYGLSNQLADPGKVPAIGVFNRPSMHYDESRYAQRQRQLQQGRDVPALRNTPRSTTSSVRDRSRSSSAQRTPSERIGAKTPLPDVPVQNEEHGNLVFDDSEDGSATGNRPELSAVAPRFTIERPDDHDHPAFRKSALPTPLSLSSPKSLDNQASPTSISGAAQHAPPEDSPTLGPNSGLSGMVRHHLRNHSAASSMYGAANQETESDGTERNGNASPKGVREVSTDEGEFGGRDDFAQHLADGARRVRERLTTYVVESDNDRSAPPTPPQSDQNKEFVSSKSGGLGTLRPKSSRGSMFDRGEKERGRAQVLKASGSQPGVVGAPPSPRKASSSRGPSRSRAETMDQNEMGTALPEENIHSGLKTFRQARRELQKMKDLEVQNRHGQRASPGQERPPIGRVTSYENGPPPALFNRKPRTDEESYGGRCRASSRATSERDRSGSETSNGERNYSRGPRLRNGSITFDEQHPGNWGPNGAAGSDAQRAMLESSTRSPYLAHMNGPPAMMSPGYVNGSCEPGGRYYAPGIQSPVPHDRHQYGRNRSGSLLGAAVSAPNLHNAPLSAPPLPPINPRRKNGFSRTAEDGSGGPYPNNSYGMTDGYAGDDDATGDDFRRARNTNGQMRHSPPMAMRPPIPHSKISSATLPGGMI